MTILQQIKKELLSGYNNYGKLSEKYGVSRARVMEINNDLGNFVPPPRDFSEKLGFWNPESELGDFRIDFSEEGVKHIYKSKMN